MRRIWKTIRSVAIAIGVLLSFVVLIELIRAYEVLHGLHPWVGYVYAAIMVGGSLVFCGIYLQRFYRNPPTLKPPAMDDLETADTHVLRQYLHYLLRVTRRLADNQKLDDALRDALLDSEDLLRQRLRDALGAGLLIETIRGFENGTLRKATTVLNEAAELEVRRCVRDVMLGVALSPWRSIDLLVVIFRNITMITRITGICSTRPRLREHLLILKDVAAVVATVNFLNYGSKLSQNLLASVPVLGRYADDLAQGIGAGLLTSVAGHAAVARCQAYRGWDEEEAETTVRRRLVNFMTDVRKIAIDDMLPQLRKPVEAQAQEVADEPGWLERVREGIGKAIDDTTAVMDSFIRRPVVAAGRGVARTGNFITSETAKGIRSGWNGLAAGTRAVGRGTTSAVRGTGRIVKATGRGIAKPFRRKKKQE